jgi:hypothetical protein
MQLWQQKFRLLRFRGFKMCEIIGKKSKIKNKKQNKVSLNLGEQ